MSELHIARWSGADKPTPAYLEDGIPIPLTREQLEDTVAEQQATIVRLKAENERLRRLLVRINKKLYGYVDTVWECPTCVVKKLLQAELYPEVPVEQEEKL